MKKIKIIFGVLAIILASCQDAREIDPIDLITEEQAFQSIQDLQGALNTAYLTYNPEQLIAIAGQFMDDTQLGANNGGQGLANAQQTLNPMTGNTIGIWGNRYRLINDIVILLDAAEDFEPSSVDEQTQLNSILGQALALRALAYLDLMTFYASDETNIGQNVFAPTSLAVPFNTEVEIFGQPDRITVAELSELLTQDLNTASALLGNPADNSVVTQQFITAVRSNLAFYTGDYQAAVDFSTELINEFPLANPQQYFNMFRDLDENEVIFRLIRNQAAGGNPGGLFSFLNRNPTFEISDGLNALIMPGDARAPVLIDMETSPDGQRRVGKYFGRPGEPLRNDIKVFRVSEQYLIRAEARARLGDLPGAGEDIAALLSARFGSPQANPNYNSLTDARLDILEQRRLELAFEQGHRYVDIRRSQDILNGFQRDPADCTPIFSAIPCNIAFGDERFSFPIPVTEVSANQDIRQNPGY